MSETSGWQGTWQWLLMIAVFVGVYALASRPKPLPLVGKSAPDITLPVTGAPDGALQQRLADLRGRVVVLDFWASWCTACRRASPILSAASEEFADAPVSFFGVNVEPITKAQLEEAHASFGTSFPTMHDRAGAAQRAYGIKMLPTVVVIAPDGAIAWAASGVPSRSDLRDAVSKALN